MTYSVDELTALIARLCTVRGVVSVVWPHTSVPKPRVVSVHEAPPTWRARIVAQQVVRGGRLVTVWLVVVVVVLVVGPVF